MRTAVVAQAPTNPVRAVDRRVPGWPLAAGVTLLLALWVTVPWRPSAFHPLPPYFDTSWMVLLHEAFVEQASFGSSFVMTYGPWGFAATRTYFPGTFGWLLVVWLVIGSSLWLAAFAVARSSIRSATLGAIWIAALTLIAMVLGVETAVIAIAALFLALVFVVERTPLSYAAAAGSAVSLALLGQMKFTYFVLAAGLMGIVALHAILTRGAFAPVVAAFGVASVAIWLLGGQSLVGMWDFLRSSLVVSSGYTQAMSLSGLLAHEKTTLPFLVVASTVIALVAVDERRRGGSFPALTAGVAWLSFILFKEAFVRHDAGHTAIGLLGLGTIAAAVAPTLRLGLGLHRPRRAACLAMLALAPLVWWVASASLDVPNDPLEHLEARVQSIDETAAVFLHPDDARAARAAGWERLLETVRTTVPLPRAVGDADLYPQDQLVLIAHGIERATRPVPQSYIAYGPRLVELNDDHLRGPDRPATAFVDIAPIDGRWPTSEDGASLVRLLADYRLRNDEAAYLVFERAGTNGFRLGPATVVEGELGELIRVPATAGAPVWVSMEIDRTVLGRVEDLLFKPAPLLIEATLASGLMVRHRLVRGLAEAGFLLSPYVANRLSFAKLAYPSWRETLAAERVVAIRLLAEDDDVGGYGSRVSLSFAEARFDPPAPKLDPE